MMINSLSIVLIFVIYCLLNICKGIVMSASPMAAQCQHACKRFTLSIQLHCSTAYKILLANQYWYCMLRKMSLKLVHYCILLSMARYFECVSITLWSHFVIKQAVTNLITPLSSEVIVEVWMDKCTRRTIPTLKPIQSNFKKKLKHGSLTVVHQRHRVLP